MHPVVKITSKSFLYVEDIFASRSKISLKFFQKIPSLVDLWEKFFSMFTPHPQKLCLRKVSHFFMTLDFFEEQTKLT